MGRENAAFHETVWEESGHSDTVPSTRGENISPNPDSGTRERERIPSRFERDMQLEHDALDPLQPIFNTQTGVIAFLTAPREDVAATLHAQHFSIEIEREIQQKNALVRDTQKLSTRTVIANDVFYQQREQREAILMSMEAALRTQEMMLKRMTAPGSKAEIPAHILGMMNDAVTDPFQYYQIDLQPFAKEQEIPSGVYVDNRSHEEYLLDSVISTEEKTGMPGTERDAILATLASLIAARRTSPNITTEVDHISQNPLQPLTERGKKIIDRSIILLTKSGPISDGMTMAIEAHEYVRQQTEKYDRVAEMLDTVFTNAGDAGTLADAIEAIRTIEEYHGMDLGRRLLLTNWAKDALGKMPHLRTPATEDAVLSLRELSVEPAESLAIKKLVDAYIPPANSNNIDTVRAAVYALKKMPEYRTLSSAGKVVLIDRMMRNDLLTPLALDAMLTDREVSLLSAAGNETQVVIIHADDTSTSYANELAGKHRTFLEAGPTDAAEMEASGYQIKIKTFTLYPGDRVIVGDLDTLRDTFGFASLEEGIDTLEPHPDAHKLQQSLANSGVHASVLAYQPK